MKFKEKASSLALCAVLLGTSIAPVSAATKTEIVGANRYETAAKIADKMGNYDTAILVNADKSLADGLSASSLAGKENAPILLVKKDSIPAATMQRLRNVKRVYVIGGEAAVSQRVVDSLGDVTYIRIQGANRIETSENVAEIVGNYNKAFIVNGNKGEADAMSVASVAARDKAPIILTNGKSSNEVKRPGVKYYVVGGSAVVSNSLVNKFGAIRLSGSDRYKTNRVVVNKFYPNSSKLYFTKGNPLVDALTVSPLAKNDGVVLVSAKSDNSILNGKDTVQVGGMNFGGSAKPDGQKPEENKPVKPDEQKPDGGTQKPNPEENKPEENKPVKPDEQKPDGNMNINSDAYQAEFREEFYKLINQHRADKGLKPYSSESSLGELSYLKSKHMGDLNYFEHDYDDSVTQYYKDRWGNNGKYPYLMIEDIYPDVAKVRLIGENIYMIYTDNISAVDLANRTFNKWKNSDGHNQAMLYDDGIYAGLGVYAKNGNTYVTAEFGK